MIAVLCVVLTFAFGACGSKSKSDDSGAKKDTDKKIEKENTAKLSEGVLAQIGDDEVTQEQVDAEAAVIALTSQPVQVYGDLDAAGKAKYQNYSLLRLVELNALKAKFEKEDTEVISPEDINILNTAAQEKYNEWVAAGYDLEAWGVTEDTILANYEFVEGYASKLIEENMDKSDDAEINMDTVYQNLLNDAGVIWSDSLSIDKETGLPTVS